MPKILVADDSIAVRKVAERLLTEAGLGVTLAANGEEALAFLAKEVPDLIVSDVIMPDKSGYEVCAFVRGQAALANTPVLLISGIVNDEVTKQAESCHADGVLKKPFQGTSLKDRVIELLGKKPPSPPPAPAKPAPQSAAQPVSPSSAAVEGEQPELSHQTLEQLKQTEAQLQKERAQTTHLMQRIAQLEAQTGRVKELEAQTGRMKDLEAQTGRIKELEVQVGRIKDLEAQVGRLKEFENQAGRARELESLLALEREQAAQAKKAAAELAGAAQRLKELETVVKHERDQSAQFKKLAADLQSQAARAQELEGVLQKERALTAQQTQSFIAAKGASCVASSTGIPCLKDYRETDW